jgi:hypothetical protein
MIKQNRKKRTATLTTNLKPVPLATPHSATPALLALTTLLDLLTWYSQNLCERSFVDPRGYRVSFTDTDFASDQAQGQIRHGATQRADDD